MPHFPILICIIGVLVVTLGVYVACFKPTYSTGRRSDDEFEANSLYGYVIAVMGCAIIGITLAVQYGNDSRNYTSVAHAAADSWEQQTHSTVIHLNARELTFDYVPNGLTQICTHGTLKQLNGSYSFIPQTATCQ